MSPDKRMVPPEVWILESRPAHGDRPWKRAGSIWYPTSGTAISSIPADGHVWRVVQLTAANDG